MKGSLFQLSIAQEIRPHGALGYKTPNEYDEYSRGVGYEKGAINGLVAVKNENYLTILQNYGSLTG